MRKSISTVVFMIVAFSVYSQTDSIGNWFVNMSVGIEAHDKRLFNYSEKESLLEMQPEFWGTYHSEFNLNRKILQNSRLSSFIGLGIGYEKSTFIRPIEQAYFDDLLKDLRVTDQYIKIHSDLSLLLIYKLPRNWAATVAITSSFLMYRNIDNTKITSNIFPLSKKTFEAEKFNLMFGINYNIDRWIIGLKVRMLNFHSIDKVIFNDIIKDPRSNQNWEWNNPLQFDFTIGYMW